MSSLQANKTCESELRSDKRLKKPHGTSTAGREPPTDCGHASEVYSFLALEGMRVIRLFSKLAGTPDGDGKIGQGT